MEIFKSDGQKIQAKQHFIVVQLTDGTYLLHNDREKRDI